MKKYPEVKRFVQETLGCSCPDEVFDHIDYQKEAAGIAGKKVTVGDRLLIYINTMDRKSSIQDVVASLLEQGVKEREERKLNRFRLVLVASCPNELRSLAERAFDGSGYRDEKTHLHIVDKSAVENF
jgi:hypothetical protein